MAVGRNIAVLLALGVGLAIGVVAEKAVLAQNPAPGYYLAEIKVNDPDAIKPYREGVGATVEKYGGRFIIRCGKVEPLEGNAPNGTVVAIAFKSLADAQRWYNSPEYKAIIEIRHKAATGRAFLVEGLSN